MKARCKHFYVSASRNCLKCAQYVDDLQKYDFNAQSSLYVKRVYYDKYVKDLETLAEEGKVLLFLDIDETILHTFLDLRLLKSEPGAQTIGVKEFVEVNFNLQSYEYYTAMASFAVFWFELDERRYYFTLRPGFLYFVKQSLDDIVIFMTTNSKQEYALILSKFLDPHSKLIYQLTSREGQGTQQVQSLSDDAYSEYAKSIKFIAKSKLLRSRYIIFDDRSSVWDSPVPPRSFLRSISYGAPIFAEGDTFPMLPCSVRETYIAPAVSFSTIDYEMQMRRLREIIGLIKEGTTVQQLRQAVFSNCVFYFVLNEQREVLKIEEDGLIKKLQHKIGNNFSIDVRVQAVWEHGGSVAASLSDQVTHVVTSANLGQFPKGNFEIVSSAFIFWSCFMLQLGSARDFGFSVK